MPSEQNDGVAAGEVSRRSGFRRHSKEYKRAIVAEYDALPVTGGDRGSMLRRENLRRQQISVWRQDFAEDDSGAGTGLARRGRRTVEEVELDRLRKDNKRLEADLARSQAALDLVGKAHALLELFSESAASETRARR